MCKSGDDVTNDADVFITCFQSDDKLTNIVCVIDDTVETGSILYLSHFITTDKSLISEVHEGNRKGRGFSSV